jgi:hypothetical protein
MSTTWGRRSWQTRSASAPSAAVPTTVPQIIETGLPISVADPRWQRRLERYGPMEAGLSIQHTTRLDELPIGPWPGLGVLATYTGVALLSGMTLFQLRDA